MKRLDEPEMTWDTEANAGYANFYEAGSVVVFRTVQVSPYFYIDYDQRGNILGYEFFGPGQAY